MLFVKVLNRQRDAIVSAWRNNFVWTFLTWKARGQFDPRWLQ